MTLTCTSLGASQTSGVCRALVVTTTRHRRQGRGEKDDRAFVRAGAPPAASVEPGPRAPPRADLVARIEAGFPCPVGVADALAIRIHNQGAPTRGRSW
ncbi:MAG: hypothetical protein U0324_44645 [Polyangiales bacterium]